MTTLLIASRNAHKVEEISSILGDRFRVLSLEGFREAPVPVEDQDTFEKNAAKKARELASWLQHLTSFDFRVPGDNAFVLADDSGLEVDALDGRPGVHSARFAAMESGEGGSPLQNSPDAENNMQLLRALQGVPLEQRTGRFRCVISLVRVKPAASRLAGYLFEGICEGRILLRPAGHGGFGYDPLFVPEGHHQTFAQLSAEQKSEISHRSLALRKMTEQLTVLGLA